MAFIELKNISLDIPVFDSSRSFRRALFNRYTGGYINNNTQSNRLSVRALENINLRLEDGDKIGLIGHNGAGKTSLLRVLAGLYEPEVGTIRWEGAITPLFNTALGMDMDDTGLENIKTIGMYLGMTPEEIEAKTPDIVEFSELGDFISLPVRTYSSGMSVRLSFAIATALDPEILLLDEGIGAGDARFAERAKKRLDSFYKKLTILVLASHSDTMIQELCNKALLLEHGRVKAFGDVNEVLEVYHRG